MKALEKAKLALRKHLLENKEQVKADLKRMREIKKLKYKNKMNKEIEPDHDCILNELIYEYGELKLIEHLSIVALGKERIRESHSEHYDIETRKTNINEFINYFDNKLLSKLRNSNSDAECRKYLKQSIK